MIRTSKQLKDKIRNLSGGDSTKLRIDIFPSGHIIWKHFLLPLTYHSRRRRRSRSGNTIF